MSLIVAVIILWITCYFAPSLLSWELPEWMGFLWWKWDETQYRPHYHTDPRGDKGFTIQGKPAEEVMRKWVKKLRNE